LEDKDLFIMPSFKETFSYATAEALAKGIPCLVNDWYGCKNVWPDEIIYRQPDEAANKYFNLEQKTPKHFREMVEPYDEENMFRRIDDLLQG
jgi:glycosyltransferase involved in cell wall biosynthesis